MASVAGRAGLWRPRMVEGQLVRIWWGCLTQILFLGFCDLVEEVAGSLEHDVALASLLALRRWRDQVPRADDLYKRGKLFRDLKLVTKLKLFPIVFSYHVRMQEIEENLVSNDFP